MFKAEYIGSGMIGEKDGKQLVQLDFRTLYGTYSVVRYKPLDWDYWGEVDNESSNVFQQLRVKICNHDLKIARKVIDNYGHYYGELVCNKCNYCEDFRQELTEEERLIRREKINVRFAEGRIRDCKEEIEALKLQLLHKEDKLKELERELEVGDWSGYFGNY